VDARDKKKRDEKKEKTQEDIRCSLTSSSHNAEMVEKKSRKARRQFASK